MARKSKDIDGSGRNHAGLLPTAPHLATSVSRPPPILVTLAFASSYDKLGCRRGTFHFCTLAWWCRPLSCIWWWKTRPSVSATCSSVSLRLRVIAAHRSSPGLRRSRYSLHRPHWALPNAQARRRRHAGTDGRSPEAQLREKKVSAEVSMRAQQCGYKLWEEGRNT